MQNYFALFNLPVQFALDEAYLDTAYREVQTKVHPDKFVQASQAEKRVAMQWATRANEAYRVLKDPIKRAEYLCALHGIDVNEKKSMHPDFLMKQMQWREELEEIGAEKDKNGLENIIGKLKVLRKTYIQGLDSDFSADLYENAAQKIREWMFFDRLDKEARMLFNDWNN